MPSDSLVPKCKAIPYKSRREQPAQIQTDNPTFQGYCLSLDYADKLAKFRSMFIIPEERDIDASKIFNPTGSKNIDDLSDFDLEVASLGPCTYLCGNSLGLQPKATRSLILKHLATWATKGVNGHFIPIEGSPLPPWVSVETSVNKPMADIVGAEPSEVAVMGSLTANLHLLMGSFYRPTTHRYKIMIEGKAFPSDRYLVESQIRSHNLDPTDALIVVEPEDPERHTLTTKEILLEIQKHGDSVAVLLFPAVSYFTGQVFDMRMITRFAHAKGIIVGFDLAHAAGNIKMNLHEWGVDFAAWCCYKYLNSGPGGIAAIFVHEKHGKVDAAKGSDGYHPRLAGWWGHKQETRFAMGAEFVPIPGAAGYQVSNPSVLDMTALKASLNIFSQTSMDELVTKSEVMTNYLLNLLDVILRCHKMPVSEQAEAFMLVRLQAWFRDGPISLCSYVAPWCQELMARHCVALVRGDVTITEVCRYPNRNGAWDAALMEILMSIYQNAVNHKLVPSIAKLKEPKPEGFEEPAFSIITPLAAKERGNMVSIKVRPDLIEHVLVHLAQHKCIIDVRKPDVIRIAPTPLYNTFRDIWRFYEALDRGINCTLKGTTDHVAKPPPRPDSSSGQPCCLFCG